jgi:chorismate synthase
MLRFLTAGESHGQALTAILEGMPSGVAITAKDISDDLARRWLGYGRGPRQRVEKDVLTILSGIRHGITLGSPISLKIDNAEWDEKWKEEMSPAPGTTKKPLVEPRPGHVDLAGMQKYNFDDARNVLERASARETAARVAIGAIAKQLLREFGIEIVSHVVSVGQARIPYDIVVSADDLERIDASQMRCLDPATEEKMVAEVKAAAKVGDSLGGSVEVFAFGVPVGLGSHVQWDRRLDANIAQAMMSIQAVKGVELGDGIWISTLRGSEAHDAIYWDESVDQFVRRTNRAGGVEGGISVGGTVRARAYMKPLSTLNRPVIETVNVQSKEKSVSFKERTDVMAVPALGVVTEAMMALVVANEMVRKFGGDSLSEMRRNYDGYIASLKQQFSGQ